MKYDAYVVGVLKHEIIQSRIVPFPGVEHVEGNIYVTTLEVASIQSTDHDSIIGEGSTLIVRSSEPTHWRAGQNISIDITPFEPLA